MKDEVYYKRLDKMPRLHPAHPYRVLIHAHKRSGTMGKQLDCVYVSSASPDRAGWAAAYWFLLKKKRKVKINIGLVREVMPVGLNQYWDSINRANPDGLMLSRSPWHDWADDLEKRRMIYRA